MEDDILIAIEESKLLMESALEHLGRELSKIRAGKASPSMVQGVMVDYYGNPTPLNQVANVGTVDARTISIQPWEKTMLGPIEKAIFEANLGLTPMNNGEVIMVPVPPLTEERRKDLVRRAKSLGEDAKVSLRNDRHKAIDFVKKQVKEGYPEDNGKRKEEKIEKMVKDFAGKIDQAVAAKEKDIMTI